jgi:hypothetical protein
MARSFSGLEVAFGLLFTKIENRLVNSNPRTKRTAVQTLLAAGLAKPDLRLLLENGYLEISPKNRAQGKARINPELDGEWVATTQVRLTPPGEALAHQILHPLPKDRKQKREFPDLNLPAAPEWNEQLQLLNWGGRITKWFRKPAPNLVALIHALEKSNWSAWSSNPFRETANHSGQYLLREAIKNWNYSRMGKFIRLRGDGSGTGFLWQRLV